MHGATTARAIEYLATSTLYLILVRVQSDRVFCVKSVILQVCCKVEEHENPIGLRVRLAACYFLYVHGIYGWQRRRQCIGRDV